MKPVHRIFLRAGGWLTILFVWLGLIIATSGAATLDDSKRLSREGEGTTALITDRVSEYVQTAQKGSSASQGHTDYYLLYEMATHQGPMSFKSKVNRAFYETVALGHLVSLRYLPQSPDVHQFYEGQLSRSGGATVVVGSAFTILGLLFALPFGLKASRGVRLLQHGKTVEATVVAIRRIGFASQLRFGFKHPDGSVVAYYSFWRFERAHKGIKIRGLIEVRYDPLKKRNAFWQGDIGRPGR